MLLYCAMRDDGPDWYPRSPRFPDPLVRAVDATRCDPALRDIHPLFPASIDVAVIGRSGELVCSAVLPAGAKAPSVANTAWFTQATREDRIVVGEPAWGRTDQRKMDFHHCPSDP